MADTRFFQTTATMPQVDFGAIYDNAVAKREAKENRELEYMDSFKKVRGALTPGLKDLGQGYFNKIQDSLNEGDMSVDARRYRTDLYNQYQDVMASGLQYTQELNKREAQVLSDPSKYNSPDVLIADLDDLRNTDITDLSQLDNQLATLPQLNKYKRFNVPTANVMDISSEFKRTVNENLFRDQDTGIIDPDKLKSSLATFLQTRNLDTEDMEGVYAAALSHQGLLTNTASDIGLVREYSKDPERAKALTEYYGDLLGATYMSQVEMDERTAAENKARQAEKALADSVFSYDVPENNTIPLTPARALKKNTNFVDTEVKAPSGVANNIAFLGNLTGPSTSYEDDKGLKKTIESIGLDTEGNPIVKITYDQKIESTSSFTNENYKVTEVVPWKQIANQGWNNEKQIKRILNTYGDMQNRFNSDQSLYSGLENKRSLSPDDPRNRPRPGEETEIVSEEVVDTIEPEETEVRPLDPGMPMDVNDPNYQPINPGGGPQSPMEQIFGGLTMDIPSVSSPSDNTNPDLSPELRGASEVEEETVVTADPLPRREVEDTEVSETEVVEDDGKDRTLVKRQYEEQDKIKALPNTQEVYNDIQSVSEIVKELDNADLDYGDQVPSSVTMMSPEALKDLVDRNNIDLGKYSVEEFQELVSNYIDEYPLFFDGMELVQV
tara:strand:- start:1330 stop:3330 length:2001 start_codon:yes stop_codon:yes gene_type:complete